MIDDHESSAEGNDAAELRDVDEPQVDQEEVRVTSDREEAEATPEQVAEIGSEFVTGVVKAMGLEGDVSTRLEGERVVIDVSGDDLGVLIGRRGQTLDALQEVVRTAVQRRLRARARILVDVESYRSRRRESLAEYAKAMARRAIERGTEIELEPMNAYERKCVHDAVGEIGGATSFSEGEEPYRKVIIRGA